MAPVFHLGVNILYKISHRVASSLAQVVLLVGMTDDGMKYLSCLQQGASQLVIWDIYLEDMGTP